MIDRETGEVVTDNVDAVTRLTLIAQARQALTDAKWALELAKQAHKDSKAYIEMKSARERVKEAEGELSDLLDETVDVYQPMLDLGEVVQGAREQGIEVSVDYAVPTAEMGAA